MPTAIPIAPGTVFGKWTVLGDSPSRNRNKEYLCRCECGVEASIRAYGLRHGRSVSCISCVRSKYDNHGQVHGHYLTRLLSGVKHRNKILDATVTVEDLARQWEIQQGRCALSGVPLTLRTRVKDTSSTASVDRIDSTKGYQPENIQWVHKAINQMKMDLPESEFFDWCNAVTAHKDQTVKLREGRHPWRADRS